MCAVYFLEKVMMTVGEKTGENKRTSRNDGSPMYVKVGENGPVSASAQLGYIRAWRMVNDWSLYILDVLF